MRRIFLLLALTCAVSLLAQMPPSTVEVSPVTEQESVQSRRYTGVLVSPASVSLVARVSGELMKQGFAEGDTVAAGQLLYQLDDVRYAAMVQASEANIARTEASLRYTKANYERIHNLFEKNVSTLDAMEAALMSYQSDEASLASARANLITAKDDLKNTKIVAPIAGKIGLTKYTVGNYLTPSSGVLATIVQLDPIRLSFAISNRDFLELFGNEKTFRDEAVIQIRLADNTIYEQKATFEFVNNTANRTTDTLNFFASVPNPDFALLPGSSVSVILSKRNAEKQCAIIPSAVMADNDSAFVWVVDAENKVHRRNVTLGNTDGVIQFVATGLEVGERVVTEGTHKVMDGAIVNPVERK